MAEGSLELKLPTIWTDEKQRWEESEKRREEKERRKKKEDQRRERATRNSQKKQPEERRCRWQKGQKKVAKHYVFTMFWGPGWSKSTLAKAAGVEPSG